ncbi:hypothetical protein [Kitasatospora sp. McL0602]|uniref:hypothetical protein n=1 Tax=Kitasatospora sp. McL0602 TaxID=3439530 RepID=UPI003F8B0610
MSKKIRQLGGGELVQGPLGGLLGRRAVDRPQRRHQLGAVLARSGEAVAVVSGGFADELGEAFTATTSPAFSARAASSARTLTGVVRDGRR